MFSNPLREYKQLESSPCVTNQYCRLLRYDDTVFLNRVIFHSNTDIRKLDSVVLSVGINPEQNRVDISSVPIKLLQESGFVHTVGKSINIDLPFHLFFKGIDQFPVLPLYGNDPFFMISASETYPFSVELILRSYELPQREQMANTRHLFVGHQIYCQDQSKIKDKFVSNIIIRGYDIPKSVKIVNSGKITQVDTKKVKSLDWDHAERINEQHKFNCIRNALQSRYSLDTYVLGDIKECVGFTKYSLILPINSVVERIEFNDDFNSDVFYITDNKWRIEDGKCHRDE